MAHDDTYQGVMERLKAKLEVSKIHEKEYYDLLIESGALLDEGNDFLKEVRSLVDGADRI